MTKEIGNKIILFLTGLLIMTLGNRMLLFSMLGTSGMDALSAGTANRVGVSVGVGIYIISIILVILSALLRKERLNIMPIIASILFGTLFDFWGFMIFNNLPDVNMLLVKITFFVIGLILATIGTAIYMLPNVTVSCLDYFMLSIQKRFNLSLRLSRIIMEGLLIITAVLVKGPIGIGTIIIMALFGPMLQYFYGQFNKINESITLSNASTTEEAKA